MADLLAGLRRTQKSIPCKYFYDERGSALFEEICTLEEYYPTRTETAIMAAHAPEMAARLGPGCLLLEYGSGSSTKTRILLDHMEHPAAYVPIDISGEHLARSAAEIAAAYPRTPVVPVCADYTGDFDLPDLDDLAARRAIYFPGSTIGNFEPHEARDFLARIARVCGPDGTLLIGVDLRKDRSILEPAYDDARGVTAAFNRNVLVRANRELGADFDVDAFAHKAVYDEEAGRIEMRLVSTRPQAVHVGEACIPFDAGEAILTEYSHKYSVDGFAALAASAGLRVEQVWTDARRWFSVQYLVVR